MAVNVQSSITKGSKGTNQFLFLSNFEKGSSPTLLDSMEAKKVKAFIENLNFRTVTNIITGAPEANKFLLDLSSGQDAKWEIALRTALECDPLPTLSNDLDLKNWALKATATRQFFYQFGTEGFTVMPPNAPDATATGYGGTLKLGHWASGNGYAAGFRATSGMSSDVIFTMPTAGDSSDNIILTSNSNALGFGKIVAGTNVTVTRSGRNFTINSTGGGGGEGTVTSISLAADDEDPPGGEITDSGTITVSGGDTGLTTQINAVDDLTVEFSVPWLKVMAAPIKPATLKGILFMRARPIP